MLTLQKLIAKIGVDKIPFVGQEPIYIAKQWMEIAETKKMAKINPIHILMNFVALTIFPFVGSPLIRDRTGLSIEAFNKLMEERKKLIPVWIKAIMKSNACSYDLGHSK